VAIIYLDCFSGASGDMLLGALIDAGVPIDAVRRALGSLAIDPAAVWTERVVRTGVSATKFCVRGEDDGPAHAHHAAPDGLPTHSQGNAVGARHAHDHAGAHHEYDHPHDGPHSHRTLPEICGLIDGSSLSPAGKDRAKALFARLGDAEAAIHGTPIEQVHLHEVGALDSIIDVVGVVFALEWLGADHVVASPLNVGSGTVRSAHGLYPVPAPATLRLLGGAPIYAGHQQAEMTTPTGALLVTAYAHSYGPVPEMRLRAVGYGAGSREMADTPNVLRVLVGDTSGSLQSHAVTVIECEIDDMNPQIFGSLMDRLLVAGALDAFFTPVQMKKNRPGTLLTVIAPPANREALMTMVFRETTTIGVRYGDVRRECLDREELGVETAVGPVRMKIGKRGGAIVNVSPEFDDLVRLAESSRRSVKEVQGLAMKAYWDVAVPHS